MTTSDLDPLGALLDRLRNAQRAVCVEAAEVIRKQAQENAVLKKELERAQFEIRQMRDAIDGHLGKFTLPQKKI